MHLRFAFTLALILGANGFVRADFVTTFENSGLSADSYQNNAGPGGQFNFDGNQLNNSFADFGGGFVFWSGWSISTKSSLDPNLQIYENQYASIKFAGAQNSNTYAVAYTFGFPVDDVRYPNSSIINLAPGTSPVSMDVTNTYYAYTSMHDGVLAKQFGPGDYLLLDVKGYSGVNGTGAAVGEVDFYLANFLGSNAHIVDDWTTVGLAALAGAKSLVFGLSSTDNDADFGMNTPAYFALDNFTVSSPAPVPGSMILLTGFFASLVAFRGKRRMGIEKSPSCSEYN